MFRILTTGSSKVDEGYSRCLKAISTLVHEMTKLKRCEEQRTKEIAYILKLPIVP